MNAELMAAGWTGVNGLKSEIENRRIAAKKYLPETAAAACPRCYGLSKENIRDETTGRILGVKPSCDHRPLVTGEWLFEKAQRESEKD